MKRRNFIKGALLAGAAATVPAVVAAKQKKAGFSHDPMDYADVAEGPYEFEDLDEGLTNEQFAQPIHWN